MADVIKIMKNAETAKLEQFVNDKGLIEIVLRGKNKRIKAFQKVFLDEIAEKSEKKEQIKSIIDKLNSANRINKQSVQKFNNLMKLNQISMILDGANLFATCVGFAIMYAKLDEMSGKMKEILDVIKVGHGIQADYEFRKVLSEHADMLDARKRKKFYSEEEMRKLVDAEYNVLSLLVEVFVSQTASDNENLIFSIYSLVSMLAVTLCYYDELYYFNNKDVIEDGNVWHSSHDTWMAIFEKLLSGEFAETLQDHAVFDLKYSMTEVDTYCISLCDQVKSLIIQIKDNQELLIAIDDSDLFAELEQFRRNKIKESIQEAFDGSEELLEDEDIQQALDEALRQVALA